MKCIEGDCFLWPQILTRTNGSLTASASTRGMHRHYSVSKPLYTELQYPLISIFKLDGICCSEVASLWAQGNGRLLRYSSNLIAWEWSFTDRQSLELDILVFSIIETKWLCSSQIISCASMDNLIFSVTKTATIGDIDLNNTGDP